MHDVCHVEFMTKNMPRLVEFYRRLFGWTPAYETPAYVILAPKQGPGVGIGSAAGEPAPSVTNYIFVEDIEATLRKVRAQGLEIVYDMTVVPGMGCYGLFKDPDGNVIGLWSALPAPKAAKKSARPETRRSAASGARAKKAAKQGAAAAKRKIKKMAKTGAAKKGAGRRARGGRRG